VTLLKTPTAQLAVNGGSQHPDKRRMGGHGATLADEVEFLLLPTPTAVPYGNNQSASPGAAVRPSLNTLAPQLPTPRATDGTKGGPNQRGSSGDLMLPSAVQLLLPTPTARLGGGHGSSDPARRHELNSKRSGELDEVAEYLLATPTVSAAKGGKPQDSKGKRDLRLDIARTDWGVFEPAIRRWETILGRPAPAPTELAPKGGQRLSAGFVEFLMGLPVGHVTDPAIGLTRNEQLKALGNGVVVQQAEAAIRYLLNAVS
jgi:DNA (cytosine-5)-methyltransferase 1